MPTTYTGSLRLSLPATGELSGTWGSEVNTGLTALIETAVAGYASVAMTDAQYTLTTANGAADEARNMVLNMTGALTGAQNVVCPTVEKLYFFKNATSGGHAVTLKTSGGTGISVPNGKMMVLFCDGTNVLDAITSFNALTIAGDTPVLLAATQDLTNKTITSGTIVGGTINNATIGASTPTSGKFTKAYTPTSSQAFTQTPTFDASLSNVFEFATAMTANVTSCTITNASAGQTISIRVIQDSVARTFASPSGAKISGSISSTPSTINILTLTYSLMSSRWEGAWLSCGT